jgi:hypothetical protein
MKIIRHEVAGANLLDTQVAGHDGKVARAASCINIKNGPLYEQTAAAMSGAIKDRGNKVPGFYFFRIVNPTQIGDMLAVLHRKRADLDFEVLDPHTFFALFKEFQAQREKPR